jgi:DNA polymerase IV (DinB-like DNA polymerase)
VVIEKDVESFLAPLPVHKLPGIGVKTNAKLNEMGVRTMGELASYDVARLREEFGVSGISFHQMAQGVDRSELVEERLPKSFSREHTFEEDTSDKRLILTKIDDLLERVVRDCKENGFNFKTLTLKIRYQDFETHTRSRTIPCLAAMPDQLKQVAYELAEPFLGSHKKIRLIGIRVSRQTEDAYLARGSLACTTVGLSALVICVCATAVGFGGINPTKTWYCPPLAVANHFTFRNK